MSKGFLNSCKPISNLLLSQIIVSNLTNVHKVASARARTQSASAVKVNKIQDAA